MGAEGKGGVVQGLNHKLNNELQQKQAGIDRLNENLNSLEQRLLALEMTGK